MLKKIGTCELSNSFLDKTIGESKEYGTVWHDKGNFSLTFSDVFCGGNVETFDTDICVTVSVYLNTGSLKNNFVASYTWT